MRNEEWGIRNLGMKVGTHGSCVRYLSFVICTLYSVICTLYSVICTLLSVICNLYIKVCGEELLMGKRVIWYVVEIPWETDINKRKLYYINGKLCFIVCRVLKKWFALIEECAILWVEWHEWVADVECVLSLQKAPFNREFGKKSVVNK